MSKFTKVKGAVPRIALSMLPYTFGVLLLGPGFALLHTHQLLSAGPMLRSHRDQLVGAIPARPGP